MHLSAHLDIDLVAVEQPDELTVLLELTAPTAPATGRPRPPATVQVVLDRSGSMTGERLDAATRALAALVDRLATTDRLGVVAFDEAARVVVPCGPVVDRAALRRTVRAIGPGGSTNLSGGLLRGLQEASRGSGGAGATVVLLSDGHANAGVTDPDALGSVAAHARAGGTTVTTIGLGLGYDERLLTTIARGGQGGHAFAEHGDEAAAALAAEVDGLLSQTVQAATLTVRPRAQVQSIHVHNDLPATAVEGGVLVELGDLWAGEQRKVLLTLGVPAIAALGLAEVATLELRSVAVPELAEQTVTLPLHVNVVPGDQAAGRLRDPKVVTELLFQQAQEAKRKAADALDMGDVDGATVHYRVASQALSCAPPSAELDDERAVLDELAARAAAEGGWVAKRSRADHARHSRKRGR